MYQCQSFADVCREHKWAIVFVWDLQADARDLMKPLYIAVTRLEADNCSSCLVIPILLDLREECKKLTDSSAFKSSIWEIENQVRSA